LGCAGWCGAAAFVGELGDARKVVHLSEIDCGERRGHAPGAKALVLRVLAEAKALALPRSKKLIRQTRCCLTDGVGLRRIRQRTVWSFFFCVWVVSLEAEVLAGLLLVPLRDLLKSLTESVDDDVWFAVAESLDDLLWVLLGIVGGVPKANDDAIVGQVRADALADGACLREGEGWQGRDEDDGVGFCGQRVEDLA
jgi:hypothetical protein